MDLPTAGLSDVNTTREEDGTFTHATLGEAHCQSITASDIYGRSVMASSLLAGSEYGSSCPRTFAGPGSSFLNANERRSVRAAIAGASDASMLTVNGPTSSSK